MGILPAEECYGWILWHVVGITSLSLYMHKWTHTTDTPVMNSFREITNIIQNVLYTEREEQH